MHVIKLNRYKNITDFHSISYWLEETACNCKYVFPCIKKIVINVFKSELSLAVVYVV